MDKGAVDKTRHPLFMCRQGGGRPQGSGIPVQTRFRSDENAAVLGSEKPRQVPAFSYGLYRYTAPLRAESRIVLRTNVACSCVPRLTAG